MRNFRVGKVRWPFARFGHGRHGNVRSGPDFYDQERAKLVGRGFGNSVNQSTKPAADWHITGSIQIRCLSIDECAGSGIETPRVAAVNTKKRQQPIYVDHTPTGQIAAHRLVPGECSADFFD